MRILHVSTRLILGGSQENTILSCEGQAALGHDVHLAFGPIFGPEGSYLLRVSAWNESNPAQQITTHDVPDMVREIAPLRDWRCYQQLKALIRDIKPDIVHTHSSKAGVIGRAAAWAVRKEDDVNIGIVHTIHGPPFMPVTGTPVERTKTKLKNTIYTHAERFAARRCHIIAGVADSMCNQFIMRRIGQRAQYTTVYSGMETDKFTHAKLGETRIEMRQELGFSNNDFVVGTVARLAEHKGHDDIIDALKDHMRADTSLKLLWVGDGWWGQRLRERLRAEGLDQQVVLTGLVPPDRVPAMMRAMDVLVHPSEREGLPRTVPQALLSGTAVIATDVDGTREVCIDASVGASAVQQTGSLIPVRDPQALREAVQWMRQDPARRAQTMQQGRALCLARFPASVMVDELEKVYANALKMNS